MRTKYMVKVVDKVQIWNMTGHRIFVRDGPHNTDGPDHIIKLTIYEKCMLPHRSVKPIVECTAAD